MTDELPEARLVPSGTLAETPQAKAAAAIADAGGSPRAKIDASRAVHRHLCHMAMLTRMEAQKAKDNG